MGKLQRTIMQIIPGAAKKMFRGRWEKGLV